MKAFFTLVLIGLLPSFRINAQTYEWLKPKLANADTIVLASHLDFGSMVDKEGNSVAVPEWVIGGHPNYKALLKHRILTPAQRTELSHILLRPFRNNKIVAMHCCMPHHIIFLVRNGHTSYLDICFDCRCLYSSKGLEKLYYFDDRKWNELGKLFDKLGLEYAF